MRFLTFGLLLIINPSPTLAQTVDPSEIAQEVLDRVTVDWNAASSQDPIIYRVDQLTDELVERSMVIPDEQNRTLFVVNGLSISGVWKQGVIFDPSTGNSDLGRFAASLLGLAEFFGLEPYPGFLESRQEALDLQKDGRRDFDMKTKQAYEDVKDKYANALPFSTAPLYQLTYGYRDGTNAKVTGFLPSNQLGAGRCAVILNLGARNMLKPHYFQIAAVHETWHCFQGANILSGGGNLLKAAIREGLATYLTALVNADFQEADLLFWSKEELGSAQTREKEIVSAFQASRNSTDQAEIQQWVTLGVPLARIPGAPSRCAYYVGWLAVQAYVERLPASFDQTQLAKHLLDLTDTAKGREQVWQALEATEQGRRVDSNFDDDASDGRAWHGMALILLVTVNQLTGR